MGYKSGFNMGYYHIRLDPTSKQLCAIVLPFGKYEYQAIPMGLCNSPDIFQEKISEPWVGFPKEFLRNFKEFLYSYRNEEFLFLRNVKTPEEFLKMFLRNKFEFLSEMSDQFRYLFHFAHTHDAFISYK